MFEQIYRCCIQWLGTIRTLSLRKEVLDLGIGYGAREIVGLTELGRLVFLLKKTGGCVDSQEKE